MRKIASDFMIEAHELRRSFGRKEAVKGISFSVRRGEIFGLLGPNGAGKTTTIRMLTGQIEPDGGTARVAGCDVVKEHEQLKQRIGVVFEEQNLYERLSARLNLEFSCWLYGLPRQRVDEVLTLVDLRERARDPVRTFSNGMRQRLVIARALLHHPPMLFLDEPGRGLDPLSARAIRQTIKQLSAEGITILLTTHLMDEADQLCQQVGFIVDGRLVACDTPRNLKLSHGQRRLTVTLQAGQLPAHNECFEDILLDMDDVHDQERLCRLIAQGRIRALHTHEASLEEVFVAVAGVQLV
jgi:ABC-2 type transport system ATP-binding protein